MPSPDAAELIFHQRPLKWRLGRGDLVLFLDLPGAAGEPLFDLLAGFFPAGEVHASSRWPVRPDELPLVAAEAQGARVIRARVDYEFYRFLPRTPVYVTVLRDPVERVVALYEHVRRTPSHPYHGPVTARHLSLYEFVCEPAFAGEVVNAQARRIAGGMFRDPTERSDRVLLQMAQTNLGEFAFFALTQWLVGSLPLLAYTFGLPFPGDPTADGSAPASVGRDDVRPATREAIEARTRVDHALVDFAGTQVRERTRLALLDLLDQNARAGEPSPLVLVEHDRLRNEYARLREEYERLREQAEHLQRAWSWKTFQAFRRWRRAIMPPGTRRDRLYQRVGGFLFDRSTAR